MAVSGLRLDGVRARLQTVLAPSLDTDPALHIDYPDQLSPTALVIVWDDPWLEQPRTMGPYITLANLVVLCVGSRIEAGPGIDQVEACVLYTIGRLEQDTYPWPVATAQSPREWII